MHIGPVAMPMRSQWHLPSLRVPWARASNGPVTARAMLGDSNSDLGCVRTWRGHGPSLPVAVPVTGTVPHWQCQSQQIRIKYGVAAWQCHELARVLPVRPKRAPFGPWHLLGI